MWPRMGKIFKKVFSLLSFTNLLAAIEHLKPKIILCRMVSFTYHLLGI